MILGCPESKYMGRKIHIYNIEFKFMLAHTSKVLKIMKERTAQENNVQVATWTKSIPRHPQSQSLRHQNLLLRREDPSPRH